ncbi:MAG: endonuclease/exonuclease/phosphatase family protein [Acidimicrobiia bacterium]|nr:endonuclease/exonuclease/phosphatase family protein [Acidimicrobiia bacterium]
MRLVTVNLYNGRVVPAALVQFLDETNPDVVCAQEVGPDAARILRERFAHGVAEGGLDHQGRALVSHIAVDPVPLDLTFRGGLAGTVDIDGVPVEVTSVHFANPLNGLWAVRVRRRQLEELEQHLGAPGRRVLVGDFNATPAWPAYRRISRLMDDGVADWGGRSGNRLGATWSKRPSWPAMLRIDHVFTTGVTVNNARLDRVAGLDHRALTVDLSAP